MPGHDDDNAKVVQPYGDDATNVNRIRPHAVKIQKKTKPLTSPGPITA